MKNISKNNPKAMRFFIGSLKFIIEADNKANPITDSNNERYFKM